MSTDANATINPDEIQWEIVHEETPDRIVFDEQGDWIIGTYVGSEWITPPPVPNKNGELEEHDPFLQLIFRNVVTSSGETFRLAVTNAGYALRMAFENDAFTSDTLTRVTLVKSVDVDQAAPMKDFRVETAKNSAGSNQ
jgi:hypothetical protein